MHIIKTILFQSQAKNNKWQLFKIIIVQIH